MVTHAYLRLVGRLRVSEMADDWNGDYVYQIEHSFSPGELATDPEKEELDHEEVVESLYRCIKCGRKLFADTQVLVAPDDTGGGWLHEL